MLAAGIAGNLEQRVAEEEDASPQPMGCRVQADILAHGQLGETDVVPVHVSTEAGAQTGEQRD